MDNVAKGQGVTRVEDGLAYVPASRHPYEYPLNEAYQSFLASGLHDRSQRWGRDLQLEDVAEPDAWQGGDYPTQWILDRIAQFYDVRHEALSRTRFIRSVAPDQLSEYSTESPVAPSFRVFLFTKNRLRSFQRCWESVRAAFPIRAPVSIEVRVDVDEHMSLREEDEYLDYFESIQDDLGPAMSLDVVYAKTPLGLRESILSSWDPDTNHEYAIFIVSAELFYLLRSAHRLRFDWLAGGRHRGVAAFPPLRRTHGAGLRLPRSRRPPSGGNLALQSAIQRGNRVLRRGRQQPLAVHLPATAKLGRRVPARAVETVQVVDEELPVEAGPRRTELAHKPLAS